MKATAVQLMKRGAAGVDRLLPPEPGVVILIYHRVGGRSGLQIDLPTALFDEQMAILAEQGRVRPLDEALVALDSPVPQGEPSPVVVTFDDGTADFAEFAVPVLERYRIPVTLYLATAFLEEGREFPRSGAPLSWSALRDAVSTGLVTVGSHTHTHALLDRLPAADVEAELDNSIGLIGDRLGTAAEHFAYPKAVAGSPNADAAVRTRFRSAALAGTRSNAYGRTDHHALARSPIQTSDGIRWFHRKLAGGMALEDRVRSLVNLRRYAALTG